MSASPVVKTGEEAKYHLIQKNISKVGFGEGANWVMLPGGMIIQRVYLGFPVGTNVRHITFPRSFTT
ncbi:hypothetical protein ACTFWD_15640, partial [Escherichia coli]